MDPVTSRKDNLLFRSVKVARDLNQKLPQRLNLWLDDLCVPIEVELEMEDKSIVDLQATAPNTRRLKTNLPCCEDIPSGMVASAG